MIDFDVGDALETLLGFLDRIAQALERIAAVVERPVERDA